MKVSISFPPLESSKGIPLLTQNRQFQWFSTPTFIYPMVPAAAATVLAEAGHQVFWDDAIAEGLKYREWLERIISEAPDVVVIETKTPVVKKHWKIVDDLKERLPGARVVLCGDHVTSLPEESLENCGADYVLLGGDYDFLVKKLLDQISSGEVPSGGVAYREDGRFRNTGFLEAMGNPDDFPLIDRELTKWKLYAFRNGNYKYTPGTYTMFGRDCWWRKDGGCTFCSWTNTYRKFRLVSPGRALEEVGRLIELGVREIFDDTGTFPKGSWLRKFCEGVIQRGYQKKVTFGCNMRPDALGPDEYSLMKKANFRLVLFGFESANQRTLDRVNKGSRTEDMIRGLRDSGKAGLEGHITTMIGYPWETKEEAENTIRAAGDLFRKGYISTLQATVVIPYPGTKLYEECLQKGWLNFTDYNRFDQREQVMKSELSTEDVLRLTRGLYKSFLTPGFILRKLFSIRSVADIKFYAMAALRVLGHLRDFSNSRNSIRKCRGS